MHCWRPLQPVAALTFDLDDTLYDNQPVLQCAEQHTAAFLQQSHPALASWQPADYLAKRQQLRQRDPEIYHDVSRWRQRAIEEVVREQTGMSTEAASRLAEQAMRVFDQWRSRIDVPSETHQTLAALGRRWPLVAITNGNARPERCGLEGYFRFVLRAGGDGRAKPFPDLFHQAAARLQLPASALLHVGDDWRTDVQGALQNGLQACWFNPQRRPLPAETDPHALPQLEITRLASLTALL